MKMIFINGVLSPPYFHPPKQSYLLDIAQTVRKILNKQIGVNNKQSTYAMDKTSHIQYQLTTS